jgi:hypothetical protein
MHPRLHNLLLTTAALLARGAAPAAGGRRHGRRRSRAGAVPVVRTKNYRCRFLISRPVALVLRYRHWSSPAGWRAASGGHINHARELCRCGKQRPLAALFFQIAQSERPDAPWANEFSGKVRFFLVDSRMAPERPRLHAVRLASCAIFGHINGVDAASFGGGLRLGWLNAVTADLSVTQVAQGQGLLGTRALLGVLSAGRRRNARFFFILSARL